jgi:hypothetical protein
MLPPVVCPDRLSKKLAALGLMKITMIKAVVEAA